MATRRSGAPWATRSANKIRDLLHEHGPGTATTVAQALNFNTGTASYHLRILADADLVEEAPELAHGKERWWRTVPLDLRDPDYASSDLEHQTLADKRRLEQRIEDIDLLQRLHRNGRKHPGLAGICRSHATFTPRHVRCVYERIHRPRRALRVQSALKRH